MQDSNEKDKPRNKGIHMFSCIMWLIKAILLSWDHYSVYIYDNQG